MRQNEYLLSEGLNVTVLQTMCTRKRRVHKVCNIYFIAWPKIMKISQIYVLFTVTRTKKERRETYKESFKGYNVLLHCTL